MSAEQSHGANPAAASATEDKKVVVRHRFRALQHIINHIGVAVASKLVPVASIFIYSHYMSVYDYGILNLSASYLWILGIVMTLNLHTAVGRYIYTESKDFDQFFGSTLLLIGGIFSVFVIIILTNLARFEELMSLHRNIIFLMLFIVLGSIAESIFSQIAIYLQSSRALLIGVAAKAIGTLLLSIVLLFYMEKDKYFAVLYADAAISLVFLIAVMYSLRERIRLVISMSHVKYMMHYSLPLIPYMLCLTLLSQFDRVMIDRYFGKQETGLYSLVYNVGILMLMIVTALLNVFNTAFFDGINKKDYARVIRDSDSIFALGLLTTAVLVLFGENIFALLVPEKYAPALNIIPVVAIGGLCFVIFQLWARLIAYVNKTYFLSFVAIFATALKIGLNALLLPLFGYKVAAITTVIAYLTMSLLCVWVVNSVVNLFPVKIADKLLYILSFSLIALFFTYVPMPLVFQNVLKVVLIIFIAVHLKDKILGLLSLRDVARHN